MLDHKDLKCLVEIVDGGSFESAGRKLNVTTGAVSQRIQRLEMMVGKPLLIRQKPPRLTGSGEKVMRYARQIWQLHMDMDRSILKENRAEETIFIAVNDDSLTAWFLTALQSFTESTGLFVEVKTTDSVQTDELFRTGQVLAAVTASPNTTAGCKTVKLGALKYQAVCSEDFAARYFKEGINADTLKRAPALHFDRQDSEMFQFLKRFGIENEETPRHFIPGTSELIKAAWAGMGWCVCPSACLPSDAHSWVKIHPKSVSVELYWKTWDLSSAAINTLSDHVFKAAKMHLE